ncbi:hypothetical protein [Sphingobacterium hotanense]|uniref:hypothetical protein n=1 Tax=Sphingobacterium hotanense TaxID=649196 RepID=UPI0021A95BFD|nr:hypothetical protein [Sphingobacterium hotanense]MCT1526911.1 hypothetical protein [Sphingobacterium hotanense]
MFSSGVHGSGETATRFYLSFDETNYWSGNKGINLMYNGYVGIGTSNPQETLSVNGNIRAKEIKVEATNWPDFVFKPDYKLLSLKETRRYVAQHGHLPGIPDMSTVNKQGVSLGEMNRLLLQKIEELTLHLIQKEDDIDQMKADLQTLKKLLAK